MKAQRRGLLVGLAVLSLGTFVGLGGNIQPQPARAQTSDVATANIINTAGQPVGTARFIQQGREVIVEASVSSLAPGFHGFHVHTTGQCSAPFTSAGGHAQSPGQAHGAHAGDMPPLLVLRDGTARTSFEIDGLSLPELLDGDGSALLIHQDEDDLETDPSGNSGGRIACAVIQPNPEVR